MQERKRQQKEYLEHKGRERAEKIRQVQLAKEQRRQQWLDDYEARNREKQRRLQRHQAIVRTCCVAFLVFFFEKSKLTTLALHVVGVFTARRRTQ